MGWLDIIEVVHDYRIENQDQIVGDTSEMQEKDTWWSKILVGSPESEPTVQATTPVSDKGSNRVIYISIFILIVVIVLSYFLFFKNS